MERILGVWWNMRAAGRALTSRSAAGRARSMVVDARLAANIMGGRLRLRAEISGFRRAEQRWFVFPEWRGAKRGEGEIKGEALKYKQEEEERGVVCTGGVMRRRGSNP